MSDDDEDLPVKVMLGKRDLQLSMEEMTDREKIDFLLKECEIQESLEQKFLLDIQLKDHARSFSFKDFKNFSYRVTSQQHVYFLKKVDNTSGKVIDSFQQTYDDFSVGHKFGCQGEECLKIQKLLLVYMREELHSLLEKVKIFDRTIQDIIDTPHLVYNTFVTKGFGKEMFYGIIINFLMPFFQVMNGLGLYLLLGVDYFFINIAGRV